MMTDMDFLSRSAAFKWELNTHIYSFSTKGLAYRWSRKLEFWEPKGISGEFEKPKTDRVSQDAQQGKLNTYCSCGS